MSCCIMDLQPDYTEARDVAHRLLQSIREGLAHIGLADAIDGRYDKWIYLVIIVAALFLAMYLLRWVVGFVLHRIARHRKAAFVRELVDSRIASRILWMLPPGGLHIMLPFAFAGSTTTLDYLQRICGVAIIIVLVSILNTLATIFWHTFYDNSRLRNRPMKGILQIVHGIIIALGCIIAVSVLINRSPTVLITGLGAFAAVLMLIFKDSILGFVAGIQLAQYDMVRNGDWITIPGTIVNGVVVDVSLNTVKVKNYDNTTIMLPPYTLISQPIQNWRGMKESGGRRIMQSIIIDLNTIQFCSQRLIDRLSEQAFLRDFMEKCNIGVYAPAENAVPQDALSASSTETNLGIFRRYILHYLSVHPDIQHEGYTLMVRTLEPDMNGIPLQIYCFTTTTHWESYEIIQSQIMEYIAAVLPMFDLYPFQNASGRDYIAQSLIAQGYSPEDAINGIHSTLQNADESKQS